MGCPHGHSSRCSGLGLLVVTSELGPWDSAGIDHDQDEFPWEVVQDKERNKLTGKHGKRQKIREAESNPRDKE